MLTAILPWMDPEQLFAILVDDQTEDGISRTPMAQPPAIPDQKLLKQLLPHDLYRDAMNAGWMGMHALSFALRYRITELQRLFHPDSADSDIKATLIESWQKARGDTHLPLFGFSPLGIHVSVRARGLCRAFDALNLSPCESPAAGVFCEAHAPEAFWIPAEGASQQAIMYRYYSEAQNFSLYGEAELETMVGAFWKRYQDYASEDLGEALASFALADTSALRRLGIPDLRRRFLQLSLQHHPDRGGEEATFILVQRHYQRLKRYLESL